jgi:hypothetical protein
MRAWTVVVLLSACSPRDDADDTAVDAPCACAQLELGGPVTTDGELAALLRQVQHVAYPDLEGVVIGSAPVDDLAYFRAWTELDTVAIDDGRAREYTVQFDPVVLSDPPEPAALAALLAHELGHVTDYVEMNSRELAEFALWYATQDPASSQGLADYEHETDEAALARGCADGLKAAREWIYTHAAADPAVLADKQRNYYTPAEIDGWTAENGECTLPSR